jgi:AcrR family transcriptional regulator
VAEPRPALRERRRELTSREISEAALTLFERHGSAATTVDQIADAAGVSQRTFFRYFERKEDAAFWNTFWNDDRAFTLIDEAIHAIRGGADPVVVVRERFSRLLAEFAANKSDRDRFLRHQRLVAVDSGLRAVALERDAALASHALARLEEMLHGTSHLTTNRAAIELAFTTLRTTFSEWARRQLDGEDVELSAVFREVLSVIEIAGVGLWHTAQRATTPPSTTSSAPVRYDDSSEAR